MFLIMCFVCFFFFKQKTAYEMRISDWSSDVCSSDLLGRLVRAVAELTARCLTGEIPAFAGMTTLIISVIPAQAGIPPVHPCHAVQFAQHSPRHKQQRGRSMDFSNAEKLNRRDMIRGAAMLGNRTSVV